MTPELGIMRFPGVGSWTRSVIALAVTLAAVLWPLDRAFAQEDGLVERSALFPGTDLFSADLSLSFRFRAELWNDLDIGLGSINRYGIQPQPSETDAGVDSSFRETTDMRLRLAPTLHIGERADLKAVIDLFSLQAGEGGHSDAASLFRSSYGIEPPGAFSSPMNSASVRMAWAELKLFHFLELQAGRIPAHWGMGLVENAALDPDTDGGDAVDGITAVVDFGGGMNASISLDYPAESQTFKHPLAPWHAGIDPGDRDDIWQWRLKFRSVQESRQPYAFDFGVFAQIRFQSFTTLGGQAAAEVCRSPYGNEPMFNCTEMIWREAFTITPDFWARFTAELAPGYQLDLEGELAFRYGYLEATQRFSGIDTGKDLYGLGGVLRASVSMPSVRLSLEFGGASGDEGASAFGVLDRPIVAEPDDSLWEESPVSTNDTVTSFMLHPNYLVDRILYRRVIGAVTNSFYLKPYGRYYFWEGDSSSFWLQGYLMYARAFVPSSTPGNAAELGLEGNLGLGAQITRNVSLLLEGSALLPLDGLTMGNSMDDRYPWSARFFATFSH